MFAMSFGQNSFNLPSTEQGIIMVVAPKKEYTSMEEFVLKAFDFMNTDGEFCDDWVDYYSERTYTPASDSDIKYMGDCINSMNQKISILHEPIIKAVHVVPPKWNDISLGIETESEYILYIWTTSA